MPVGQDAALPHSQKPTPKILPSTLNVYLFTLLAASKHISQTKFFEIGYRTMALVRERITELGTVLFGLGLTAEKEANQTIRLWSAVVELDNYYRVVENNWFTIPQATSDQFPQEADRISKLVKEAQGMRHCYHFKETISPEAEKTACLLCELHIQSIIVDLRARMGWLRNLLRGYFLPDRRNLLVRFDTFLSPS